MADLSDPEIASALKEIQNPSSPTNWLLLGYVMKSDTKLKVAGQGSGGLAELQDELSDGKALFALLRMEVNKLPKLAYISWCGEGVTGMKKGLFAGHAQDVAKLFKGFHAQVNARSEKDVQEKDLVAKLTKATGAAYDAGAKNQGSAKLVPTSVAQGRSSATQSNASKAVADKSGYKMGTESNQFWTERRTEEEQEKSNKTVKPQRPEYNVTSERDKFWSEQQSSGPGVTKTKVDIAPGTGASAAKKSFEAAAKPSPSAPVSRPPPTSSRPPPAAVPPPAPAPEESWEPEPTPEQPVEEPAWETPAQEEYQETPYEEAAPVAEYQEPPVEDYQQTPAEEYPAETYPAEEYPAETYPASGGVVAVALYDYDAQNTGDLSFREGQMINILDQSDPAGWWQGEVDGVTGYFPMNFVEVRSE